MNTKTKSHQNPVWRPTMPLAVGLFALMVMTATAQLALPVYEPFNWANNERLGAAVTGGSSNYWPFGNSPGTGSALITNQATLSYPGLPAGTGLGLWFTPTTPSSGRNRALLFTTQTMSSVSKVYVSFLLNVQAAPAGLKQIFALSPSTSGSGPSSGMTVFLTTSNTLALAKSSTSAAGVISANVLSAGTHLVVLRYQYNAATSSDDQFALWVDAALGLAEGSVPAADLSTTSGADASTLSSLWVVHASGGPACNFFVDEIRVANTWALVAPLNCAPGTSFSVTGGGSLCSGDPGVAVGLAGSETGVDYQLRLNGADIGAALPGTGLALDFGAQAAPGSYTVQASNTTSACIGLMTGSATVTLLASPNIGTPPTDKAAALGASVSFPVIASGAGLSYQWRRDGTNLSNGGSLSGVTSPTLVINPVALSDAATSVNGYDVVISGTCTPPVTSTRVALDVTVPQNLTWAGDGTANLWDTVTANWTGGTGIFAPNDNVTFNNSGSASPPVDLVGVVSPLSITVGGTQDYTIGTTTSGSIGGSATLAKSGSGKLTLTTVNSFTGKTTITGGTVSIATASHLGAAPGAYTADHLTLNGGAIEYTASGSIAANRGTTLGVAGGTYDIPAGILFTNTPITTGPGSLTKTGDGTLTVAVANSYAGGTVISNGTLAINNVAALGTGPLTLAGGTLNPLSALNAVTNDITVSASSTISGGNIAPQFSGVLSGLAGTLTFNGTVATFAPRLLGVFTFNRPVDLATANTSLRLYNLSGVQTYNGIFTGAGNLHRRSATAGVGGDAVFNGDSTFTGGVTLTEGGIGFGIDSTGDPVTSGPIGTGTLTFADSSSAPSVRTLFASGGARTVANPIVIGGAQTNTIKGANDLTLTGTIDLGTATRLFIVNNTGVTTFAGALSNGGLTKQGAGVLRLNGVNSYTGDTTVDAGTLAGTGTIAGNVIVNAGGNLAPGAASRGTLTVNGDVTLGGNFTARIHSGGVPTRDQLAGATAIAYGGTLTIVNQGPALTVSDSFKLFDAAGYSGSFASISPLTPGAGLAWDTSTLTTDGTLRIAVAGGGPSTSPTNIVSSVSGSTLTLSWPESHKGWTLQAQTNSLAVGLTTPTNTWFDVTGTAATNQWDIPITKDNPAVFYRLRLPQP